MDEKHILIVDSDEATAKVTATLLESRNYRVDVVHNGIDTFEKIKQYPDLILLDRMLPDMEGLEICQKIRDDRTLRHISIIVLTSCNTSTERTKGLCLGADDYITKSIDDAELIARIEAVLRRSQALRQVQGEKSELASELKKILTDELIAPYFQPIYSMESLKPIGLEALSRPPEDGLIDNAEFLFKTALILDMYAEVEVLCWRTAASHWRERVNQKKLFLNCTPYFIESGRLNEDFLDRLSINPRNIVVEITERTAIQQYDVFLKELNVLRKLGVKIAVDDVGSGFASLDMVVAIRPDIVKIDQQLVRMLHKDELKCNIIQAVISFCKKSNIMTIAEGIEVERELEIVNEFGVDAVQGYFLAKPTLEIDPDIFSKKFGE